MTTVKIAVICVLQVFLVFLGMRMVGIGHGTDLFLQVAFSPFGMLAAKFAWTGFIVFWTCLLIGRLLQLQVAVRALGIFVGIYLGVGLITIGLYVTNNEALADVRRTVAALPGPAIVYLFAYVGSLYMLWGLVVEKERGK